MQLVTLSDISLKESPLHYRRSFNATARFVVGNQSPVGTTVEFVIESTATGRPYVSVRFTERLPFPLVPALRLVKERVSQLEQDGQLP